MSENGAITGTVTDTVTDTTPGDANLNRGLETVPEILLSYVVASTGYRGSNLPKNVKGRVRALEKVQLDIFKAESKFYAEVHELESKYVEKYKPLFDRRLEILNGTEPTEQEANYQDAGLDHEALAEESNNPGCQSSEYDENTKGIPSFWYTTLMTIPLFEDLIRTHDEEVMKLLTDIRLTYNDEKSDDLFFEIHFEFAENKYFGNKVLTKKYYLNTEPSSCYPPYEGLEIYKSSECPINWKEGMNLTSAEDVAKKTGDEVDKKTHSSFFDLFVSHDMNADSHKDLTEEEKIVMQHEQLADFKVGHVLRSSVIPRAILHFTGGMGFL